MWVFFALFTFPFLPLSPQGTIDEATWTRFLLKFSPTTTEVDAMLYYQIATSYTGKLDIISFMDLKSHLSYKFIITTKSKEVRTPPLLIV